MPNLLKYGKLILGNVLVFLITLVIIEKSCEFFISDINLVGTSSDIFIENRYNNTIGFLPNSKGYSFDNSLELDSLGFIKSICSQMDKKKDNILFLGDSVTQGVGVDSDSTFVAKLACSYNDSINIINASLIGYKFSDYYNVVETLVTENDISLKMVVINYCLNDVYSNNVKGMGANSKSLFGKILTYPKENSYLYIWLKNILFDRKKAYYIYDSNLYKEKELLQNLNSNAQLLLSQCKQHNIELKIVIHPYEYQIRENNTNLFFPQDEIQAILNDLDISVYRSEEFLAKRIQKSEDLYLYGDGIHFSKKGHSLLLDFYLNENILTN